MLRSLYSGISGMKVNQAKLDVIGNNIANVGTTSFKGGRVRFQDMLSQTSTEASAPSTNQGGVNPRQIGLGVQLAGVDTVVSQGMMQPTSRNLDVAMDGEGYIMVGKGPTLFKDGVKLGADHTVTDANGMETMFTRDGALTLDNQGNLLTSDGYRVLGYPLVNGTVTPATDTEAAIFTPTDAAAQSMEQTNETQGTPAVAVIGDINFVDTNKEFGSTGVLKTLRIPDQVFVPATEAASADPSATPPVVEAAAVPAHFVRVKTFSIEKTGVIKAVLDDGRVTAIGQIAVASFKNSAGLTKLGKNLYQQSSNAGLAVLRSGVNEANDNSKGYGDMLQGMLEMSNVDLAEQFTDMIVASRAFQASSKVISTGDEILQDILALKR